MLSQEIPGTSLSRNSNLVAEQHGPFWGWWNKEHGPRVVLAVHMGPKEGLGSFLCAGGPHLLRRQSLFSLEAEGKFPLGPRHMLLPCAAENMPAVV